MGLFGPTKNEIKEAISESISESIDPRVSINTSYIIRATVSKYTQDGVSKFYKDFPMSEVSFEKSICRKAMYESIKSWFKNCPDFQPKVSQINKNTIHIEPTHTVLEPILVASKTDTLTYYPLTYKTEESNCGLITICTVDPNTLKENWMGFKPNNIESLNG